VISIVWYMAAGPDLVFAFDACARSWVYTVGWGIIVIGVMALGAAYHEGTGVVVVVVSSILIVVAPMISLFLGKEGVMSATGLLGCYVVLLIGTLPAVAYAVRKS